MGAARSAWCSFMLCHDFTRQTLQRHVQLAFHVGSNSVPIITSVCFDFTFSTIAYICNYFRSHIKDKSNIFLRRFVTLTPHAQVTCAFCVRMCVYLCAQLALIICSNFRSFKITNHNVTWSCLRWSFTCIREEAPHHTRHEISTFQIGPRVVNTSQWEFLVQCSLLLANTSKDQLWQCISHRGRHSYCSSCCHSNSSASDSGRHIDVGMDECTLAAFLHHRFLSILIFLNACGSCFTIVDICGVVRQASDLRLLVRTLLAKNIYSSVTAGRGEISYTLTGVYERAGHAGTT